MITLHSQHWSQSGTLKHLCWQLSCSEKQEELLRGGCMLFLSDSKSEIVRFTSSFALVFLFSDFPLSKTEHSGLSVVSLCWPESRHVDNSSLKSTQIAQTRSDMVCLIFLGHSFIDAVNLVHSQRTNLSDFFKKKKKKRARGRTAAETRNRCPRVERSYEERVGWNWQKHPSTEELLEN